MITGEQEENEKAVRNWAAFLHKYRKIKMGTVARQIPAEHNPPGFLRYTLRTQLHMNALKYIENHLTSIIYQKPFLFASKAQGRGRFFRTLSSLRISGLLLFVDLTVKIRQCIVQTANMINQSQ